MRPDPPRKITDWFVRQPSDELFTAAVCQAEILSGLAVMPSGRRRAVLEEAARAMFTDASTGASSLLTSRRLLPTPSYSRRAGRPGGRAGPLISCWPRLRARMEQAWSPATWPTSSSWACRSSIRGFNDHPHDPGINDPAGPKGSRGAHLGVSTDGPGRSSLSPDAQRQTVLAPGEVREPLTSKPDR
jgi:hypothetical protein